MALRGCIEYCDQSFIKGWAYNERHPGDSVALLLCVDNEVIAEFSPSLYRWDLKKRIGGPGRYGFHYTWPPGVLADYVHEVEVLFEQTAIPLENSPISLSCLHEQRFVPFLTSDLTGQRALVLSPHPDDESLGCGGAIALHRRAGDSVKVVFLTDGAHGAWSRGDDTYISLREDEAREACRQLGVTDIEFWRYPDRGLSCDAETIRRFESLLDSFNPELVYAPSPFEFHADHVEAARLAWAGAELRRGTLDIAYYEVNTPFRVNCLVDTSSVVPAKRSACDSYKTQHSERNYSDYAEQIARFRTLTLPPQCTHAEGFWHVPAKTAGRGSLECHMIRHIFPQLAPEAKDEPLVSVIVRTFNRSALLRDALSSLVTQTYPQIEAVVVNAGSEAVTHVVDEFSPYLRIVFVESEKPLARAAAANAGLAQATGKYLALLDDDDILYTSHIEKLVRYLEVTGDQFAYSDCEKGFYEWDGTALSLKCPREPFHGVDFDADELYQDNMIPSMTAMFTRAVQERIGSFDEIFPTLEDWDFWIRLSRLTTPQRLPGITAEYRCLSNHGHDFVRWKNKIYSKHEAYHPMDTKSGPERWARMRLDAIQEENRHLRQRLVDNEARIAAGRDTPRYARNHLLWRAERILRRLLRWAARERLRF